MVMSALASLANLLCKIFNWRCARVAASDNVSAACCDAPVLVDERLIGDLVECVETVNT